MLMATILVWTMKPTIWINHLLLQSTSCLILTSELQDDEYEYGGEKKKCISTAAAILTSRGET